MVFLLTCAWHQADAIKKKNTSLKMLIMNLDWWEHWRCLWKYNLWIVVLVDQDDVPLCLTYLQIVINPVTNLCLIPSCPSVMLMVHLFWALMYTFQNDTSNDQSHLEGAVLCYNGIKCHNILGKYNNQHGKRKKKSSGRKEKGEELWCVIAIENEGTAQ